MDRLQYKLIAIDFDGTVADTDFPVIRGMIPGARRVIRKIKEHGGRVMIWTARSDTEEARRFLLKHGIPFDGINENFPEVKAEYAAQSRKIMADVYIDDRNLETVTAGGIDWLQIEKMLFKKELEK